MCPTLAVRQPPSMVWVWDWRPPLCCLMSNIVVSAVKSFIPDKVRIPSYIVIIATFVTIVDLVMAGYLPDLHKKPGTFYSTDRGELSGAR